MFAIRNFFSKNPSLAIAFSAALGAEASLQQLPALLLLLFPMNYMSTNILSKLIFSIGFGALAFFLTEASIHFPNLPEEGVVGTATISIDQLSYKTTTHQSSWVYRGKVLAFKGLQLKGIPFYLSLPGKKKDRPLADCNYDIECRLKKGKGNQVILKPLLNSSWTPLNVISWSETRFFAKQKVKTWIEQQFSSPSTIQFLSGLVIGEFDDRQLRQDFGRFGLLHLLAISGFHFSLLAMLLELLFRPFLSPRGLTLMLFILLSIYFLFLGWGLSILRAWLTLLIYLGAYFYERFSSPLNSLGIALLFSVFFDPFLLENLGFQFSFLTTAAILLGLEPFSELLHKIFPKRNFDTTDKWSKIDQFTYMTLGFMKNGLSLAFSTTLIALPISIYYFDMFPILSLFYNIFFPLLVSISMGLLMLGAILFFIPPLASQVHLVNDYFTSFILNMTYDVPKSWDIVLTFPRFSTIQIIFYIIIVFTSTIYFKKSKEELKYVGIKN